jgi:hypothetical protein
VQACEYMLRNTRSNNQRILPVTEKLQQQSWARFSGGELYVAVEEDDHAARAQGGADGGGPGQGQWLAGGETASWSTGRRRGSSSPDSCSSSMSRKDE